MTEEKIRLPTDKDFDNIEFTYYGFPFFKYLRHLEIRVQKLEADLKRREDIDNAPAKYED